MKCKSTGFDPENVFINGSLNVTSSFCLNEFYDFRDHDQVKVMCLLFIIYRSKNVDNWHRRSFSKPIL